MHYSVMYGALCDLECTILDCNVQCNIVVMYMSLQCNVQRSDAPVAKKKPAWPALRFSDVI